jgi:TRAP-type C4-dicarboxylate transport system permease small subunit
MDKFDRFNRFVSTLFEWIGIVGLLLMMVITCADVVGAKLFLRPVPGSIDIVMLSQLVAISFACATALLAGRHVQVDFFVPLLPPRIRDIVECVMSFFALVLFLLIIWRLSAYGHSLFMGNEVSPTASIPLYPFSYGVALACIPVSLVLFSSFLKSLMRSIKR